MLQQEVSIETAIMPFKLQQLVEVIMEKKQFGVEDAFHYLYTSNCYQLLLTFCETGLRFCTLKAKVIL